MNDKLKQIFEKKLDKEKRYLLGLSGGADSMALFYALSKWKYCFEVCTIDHGSRDVIADEIKEIKKVCKEHQITFHEKRVEGVDPNTPNLEDRYRQKRYALFDEVYKKKLFDGLILGHHADDQIETVLKRILEGASIQAMQGIGEHVKIGKMHVIRPLLAVRKKEIISWLEIQGLKWFEDETNRDCRYLRARMREKILPDLTREFGKEFGNNLLFFAEKMKEVSEFFLETIPQPISGPFGNFYPFTKSMKKIEADFYLRQLFEIEEFKASREEVERFCRAICDGEAGIELKRKTRRVILDKHGIFFLEATGSDTNMQEVDYLLERGESECSDWRGVFCGKVCLALSGENIEIRLPSSLNERLPSGVSLKKWYSRFGVPVHMRLSTPVVYENDQLVGEILTGEIPNEKGENWVLTFMPKKNTICICPE